MLPFLLGTLFFFFFFILSTLFKFLNALWDSDPPSSLICNTMPRKHDKHLQRRLLEQLPGALNQSRGFKSLLFQDRDLAYSAISELESLNTAHSAFSILSQTMFNLNETQERQGPPTQRPSKLETDFE